MRFLFLCLSPFPLKVGYVISDLISSIYLFLNLNLLKITFINISLAFPDLEKSEVHKIAKMSLKESFRSYYETFYCFSRPNRLLSENILKIENNFLLNSYQKSNGFIILSLHNRSIDFLFNFLAHKFSVLGIFKPAKSKFVNNFIKRRRENDLAKVFETNYKGVRELFKHLSEGSVVAMAADQVPADGKGEYAQFFSHEAYTTTLVPSLASKTGKDVLCASLNSNDFNDLSITFSETSLNFNKIGKSNFAQSLNHEIEKMISKKLIDYNWEYKRYKKQRGIQRDPYK